MADYYPLIARAISGLDPSAPGESRRALYGRARAALISQLRSVQPPLSESEITRERLSLEEAVRKVESEAAQRARAARPNGGGARAGDALRRSNGTGSSAAAAPRPRPAAPPPPSPSPSRNDRPPLGQDERPDSLRARSPRSDTAVPPPPPLPSSRPQPSAPPPVSSPDPALPPVRDRAAAPGRRDNGTPAPGVRGFRDIAADADDLGRAASQANRAARKT